MDERSLEGGGDARKGIMGRFADRVVGRNRNVDVRDSAGVATEGEILRPRKVMRYHFSA
jgi:hypothetical protein